MANRSFASRITGLLMIAVLICAAGQTAAAQAQSGSSSEGKVVQTNAAPANAADKSDQYFKTIYKDFYLTYKLGPGDEVAIRVLGQPDYSLEKVKVSPVGRIYHPLLGDVDVANLTVDQLTMKLTTDLSQYIIEPKVSVSLLEANSAKIGVIGEVVRPGIVIMARPMTVLDAIAASGGITSYGSQSSVTVLRQGYDRPKTFKVNVKRLYEGKAEMEDNVMLQAGDTVIVHGNLKKKLSFITSLAGFGSFLAFVAGR